MTFFRCNAPHSTLVSALVLMSVSAVVTLASCGPTVIKGNPDAGSADGPVQRQPHDLTHIVVSPTNSMLEFDLNTPGSQAFTATGVFADGVDEDLTASATWELSNPLVGTMTGATLQIPGFAVATAHVARVKASRGAIFGEAQITVVAYRKSGTQQDFFFVLPYQDAAGPASKPLEFSTTVPALDVFFSMDTTASMFGSISNLQSTLTSTVVPGIQAAVANSQFGVGAFEDFPLGTYGSPAPSFCGFRFIASPDQPFRLMQTITDSIALVADAVDRLRNGNDPIGCGNDWPESGIEALFQAATGAGLAGPAPTMVPANTAGVGGVAFRQGTMPVVLQISDAMTHGKGETATCSVDGSELPVDYAGTVADAAHSRAQAKQALGNICAKVVGIAAIQTQFPGACSAQEYLEDFATTTGARVPPAAWDVGTRPANCPAGQCCTGFDGAGRAPDVNGLCPLVFLANPNGSGVGNNIVTGVQMLTRFATFDVTSAREGVTTDIDGNPLPAPRTTADFIKAVQPVSFVKPPPPPALPDLTFDATTFHNVTPGTKVSFSISAFNDFLPSTNDAQIFRATVKVLAGGCTPLDQRDVMILVPPTPIVVD